MARTPTIESPAPPVSGAALVPIHEDSRVVDVQRRLARASALAETADARVKALRAAMMDAHATELDRLRAEADIDAAEHAWRQAEIDHQQLGAEARDVRAAVLAEMRIALEPRLKAATFAVVEALERVRATEQAELLDALGEWMRVMGSGHPRAQDLCLPFLTELQPGAGTQLDTWKAYLNQLRWD